MHQPYPYQDQYPLQHEPLVGSKRETYKTEVEIARVDFARVDFARVDFANVDFANHASDRELRFVAFGTPAKHDLHY